MGGDAPDPSEPGDEEGENIRVYSYNGATLTQVAGIDWPAGDPDGEDNVFSLHGHQMATSLQPVASG